MSSAGLRNSCVSRTKDHLTPPPAKRLRTPAIRNQAPGSSLVKSERGRASTCTETRFDLHGDAGRRYVLFEAGANDFDSTLVAGSSALIRELVQSPGLEVLPLRPDADPSRDGNVPNRPE